MHLSRRRFGAAAAAGGAALVAFPRLAAAKEIVVAHWGNLMYGVPYAVAMDKGYFKEAGIDITGIITSTGGGTSVRNTLANDIPFGDSALSAAVHAARQGINIKIVAMTVGNANDILWVVKKDSPIKSIKDLVGKKAGYTNPKSTTDMLLRLALDASGVPLDKVERVSTNGLTPGLTALNGGAVDTAPIVEPVWSRLRESYRPLFFIKDVLAPTAQSACIVEADYMKKNPVIVRGLIAARRKGVDFLRAEPKEAAGMLAKHYRLDPALAEIAMRNQLASNFWSDGRFDYAAMDRMVKGLQIVGDLEPGPIDWVKLVDESYLPDDLKTKKA